MFIKQIPNFSVVVKYIEFKCLKFDTDSLLENIDTKCKNCANWNIIPISEMTKYQFICITFKLKIKFCFLFNSPPVLVL